MSAPIGSSWGSFPYFGVVTQSDYLPNAPRFPIAREDKPMKAYRIRNIQTNQYWSNGRWRRCGKVYLRMCDVKGVLNSMSQDNFCKSEVVDYLLVSNPENMISLDQFNRVLNKFKDELHEVTKRNN